MRYSVGKDNENRAMEAKKDNLRLLLVCHIYRLALVIVLFALPYMKIAPETLGSFNPEIYRYTLYVYAAFSLLAFLIYKLLESKVQASIVMVVDICALMTLVYSSGGVNSGLAVMLLPIAAVSVILLPSVFGQALATFGGLSLIGVEWAINAFVPSPKMTIASIFALAAIAIATLMLRLSQRALEQEELAISAGKSLLGQEQINEAIIQVLSHGVVVLRKMQIAQANPAAKRMLEEISPEEFVHEVANADANHQGYCRIMGTKDSPPLRVSLKRIKAEKDVVLAFIFDEGKPLKLAEQLRLASLGELTANIAHEIRNPLSAITGASQLLEPKDDEQKKCKDLITKHSQRINKIIENMRLLATEKSLSREMVELSTFLKQFVDELVKTHPTAVIELEIKSTSIVRTNLEALRQILQNIADNGLRASRSLGVAQLHITLKCDDQAEITVRDWGPGLVEPQKIFEPFYSKNQSMGLGLAIARNLAEHLEIHISARNHEDTGAIFALTMAKQEV